MSSRLQLWYINFTEIVRFVIQASKICLLIYDNNITYGTTRKEILLGHAKRGLAYLENGHLTGFSNVPATQPGEVMIHQTKPKVSDTYLVKNLKLLRKCFAMTRKRNKWYIKKNALESFVLFSREAFNGIEAGRIKCGDKLDSFYKDKILDRNISEDKASVIDQ